MNEVYLVNAADELCTAYQQHYQLTQQLIEALEKMSSYMPDAQLMKERADKMRDCGTTLVYGIDRNGVVGLVHANFCRQRICPMCQWRRSLKAYSRLSAAVQLIGDDYRYFLMSLTRPNVSAPDLPKELDELMTGYNRLMKNERVARTIHGVYRTIEMTYNRDQNTFHPHIHCFCCVRKSYYTSRSYIKRDVMVQLWNDANGWNRDDHGYDLQLDMRPVRENKGRDYNGAISEVCKYVTKPISLFEEDRPTALRAVQRQAAATQMYLSGRRLVYTSGNIKQALHDLNSDNDNAETDMYDDLTGELVSCTMYKHTDNGYEYALSYTPEQSKKNICSDAHTA